MTTTANTIKKQSKTIAKYERRLARLKTKRRKEDTRHKILLGGLVVKAQLNHLPLDDFYKILLDIKSQLENEPELKRVFQLKGERAFMEYDKVTVNSTIFSPSNDLTEFRQRTRQKIQFGGLIIKAELPLTTKAEVLGVLVSLQKSQLIELS